MGSAYQIRDQSQLYFLTFQVVGWADIYSRKSYRDIVLNSFEFCRYHKGMELYAYVIMTNHVHCILRSRHNDLSGLVRDFKKFTSRSILNTIWKGRKESRREWLELIFRYHAKFNKRVKLKQLWTHHNHAVELSTNERIDSRVNYIHQNPVKAGWVELPEDYLYSSARNYSNRNALIEIDYF